MEHRPAAVFQYNLCIARLRGEGGEGGREGGRRGGGRVGEGGREGGGGEGGGGREEGGGRRGEGGRGRHEMYMSQIHIHIYSDVLIQTHSW